MKYFCWWSISIVTAIHTQNFSFQQWKYCREARRPRWPHLVSALPLPPGAGGGGPAGLDHRIPRHRQVYSCSDHGQESWSEGLLLQPLLSVPHSRLCLLWRGLFRPFIKSLYPSDGWECFPGPGGVKEYRRLDAILCLPLVSTSNIYLS